MSYPTSACRPFQYIVEGGHRLTVTIEPSGNKNAALPIIAAALLTEHPAQGVLNSLA
jgi:UDP-N-acetylglucosamine 1-carboxyvinyltransferase